MKSSLNALHGSAQLLLDIFGGTVNIVEQLHITIAQQINLLSRALEIANETKVDNEIQDADEVRVANKVRIVNKVQSTNPLQRTSELQAAKNGSTYATMRTVKNGLKKSLQATVESLSIAGQENISINSTKTNAALNGVCGDHLHASNNPLAIQMHLRSGAARLQLEADSLAISLPDATPHIVVMIHGLCLSHEFWCKPATKCLGEELAETHDYTAIQLSYNTGLHISTNGQQLALQLENLVNAWPVKVKKLTLIGHSMGGLVIRSAAWYAEINQAKWLSQFKHAVYVGSPHHGAALAKAGHWLTAAMRASKYASPFALGRHTSFGIKDLRHGNLIDEDWEGIDQDGTAPDNRNPIPLSPHAKHHFIAASLGAGARDLNGVMLGDWLVRLGSATGQHRDELRRLNIDPENFRIFHGTNHFNLLDNKDVHEQIVNWLN